MGRYAVGDYSRILQRTGLKLFLLLIVFCFLLGNDQFNAHAAVLKSRAVMPKREAVKYESGTKPVPAWLLSTFFAGGDNCATATVVGVPSFNDSGNTTGANNTISNYNSAGLPFPYPGPDHFYKIVIGPSGGTIGASMSLTGSTLDGVLFLLNQCPAGPAATIPAGGTLANSQDAVGPGAGPETLPVTTVPAGTYYIAIDSYYGGGAAAAGPYSITITTTGLAPTAAAVTVGGRVLASGSARQGLANAVVTLSNASGVERTVVTGAGGTFNFEEVESGQTYTLTVRSRRYTFAPRVIEIVDNVSNLNISPE